MYTMRHKFSNFQFIFKMQIGIKMKRNKIFNPLIFYALAITISNFHWISLFNDAVHRVKLHRGLTSKVTLLLSIWSDLR